MLSGICCWATGFSTAGRNWTAVGVSGSSLFLGPEPPTPSSPIKPEHYITKVIPSSRVT